MVGLPLLKLGGLAMKTLAKPVAKRLKHEATTRPGLKQLYVNVGQWTHRATAWITISAAGHKSLGVKDLEEAAAFARGADFLSEAFVFIVGGGILTFEYTRSNMSAARKEAEKEQNRQQFREDLETRFLALEGRLEALEEKNAAGWARLFGGKEGYKDQLEAPHFADPDQVKQRRRRLSQRGGATPAPVTAAAGGGVGNASPSLPIPIPPGALPLPPPHAGPSAATGQGKAGAGAAGAGEGGVAVVVDSAVQLAAAEEASVLPARAPGLWGRLLGWVGVGGGKQQGGAGRGEEAAAQAPPTAAVGLPTAAEDGFGKGGGSQVKATSALVVGRGQQQRRPRTEEDRYWWRILVV